MVKKYHIYQFKDEYMEKYGFMHYDFLKNRDVDIKKDMYALMYSDAEIGVDCPDEVYLEKIFRRFNIERPEDFKGHSLSVSDVVVLNDTAYYTDSFGFKRLESF